MPALPVPTPTEDATDAREQAAARLERLARRIRECTTTDVAILEEVYAEITRLNVRVRSRLFEA